MFLRTLTINLGPTDTVTGVIADYSEIVDEREMPVGTRRLPARDIDRHLPSSAAMISQIDAMIAQVSALTAERDAAVAQVSALTAERDAAVAQVSALTAERDAAVAQVST